MKSNLIFWLKNFLSKIIFKNNVKVDFFKSNNPYCIDLRDKSYEEKLQIIDFYNNQKMSRKAHVVAYTAIFGGDGQPFSLDYIMLDWDYVLFTDREIKGTHPFEIRRADKLSFEHAINPIFYKINPHKVLSEYKFSLWLDEGLTLKKESLEYLNDEIGKSSIGLMLIQNMARDLSEEIRYLKSILIFDFLFLNNLLTKYESLSKLRVFETSIVLRDNERKNISKFNEVWWDEYLNGVWLDKFSCRYSLSRLNINPGIISNLSISCIHNRFGADMTSASGIDLIGQHSGILSHLIVANSNAPAEFCYEKRQSFYSIKKSPFEIKRAYLNACQFNFIEEGLESLKVQFERGDKKERIWASWFIALIYLNEFDSESAKLAFQYLQNCELGTVLDGGDKYVEIVKNELLLVNSDAASPTYIENYDNDLIIQSINFTEKQDVKRLLINRVFSKYGLFDVNSTNIERITFDAVNSLKKEDVSGSIKLPLVSIVVPCFNCADIIEVTFYSLINQTWKNLEIILIDDCSTDNTLSLLRKFESIDKRIIVIANQNRKGPYGSRNVGLKIAKGKYVTLCQPGIWSHPQRIEFQSRQLETKERVVANCASWARCDKNLSFFRNGQPFYCDLNLSSLMFLRCDVIDALGEWDNVLFAADREFYKRLIKVFGKGRILELDAVTTLEFNQDLSMSDNDTFSNNSFPYGARLEYIESYEYWHGVSKKEDLKLCSDTLKRKFPVPQILLNHEKGQKLTHEYVFAADLRDKTSSEMIIELIYRAERNNRSWALAQINRPNADARKKITLKVRELLSELDRSIVVYGEFLSCSLLQIVDANKYEKTPSYCPTVNANKVEYIDRTGVMDIEFYDTIFRDVFSFESSVAKLISPDKSVIHSSRALSDSTCLFPNFFQINMSELHDVKFEVSPLVTVIMPCIDLAQGLRTANILSSRAGCDATVIIAMDDIKGGFISTLNKIARISDSRFITYVAQDAFPGRDWLKIALESIETNRAGLLAFNDGKWFGRIASFGLVRKSWIEKFYDSEILCSHYKSHKADNEITVLAKLDNAFVYNPESTLIEVDYTKDEGGSNPIDDEKFKERFNSQFGKKFSKMSVEDLRKEYRVQAHSIDAK